MSLKMSIDALFIISRLLEEYCANGKSCIVNQVKVFDIVPKTALLCTVRTKRTPRCLAGDESGLGIKDMAQSWS